MVDRKKSEQLTNDENEVHPRVAIFALALKEMVKGLQLFDSKYSNQSFGPLQ